MFSFHSKVQSGCLTAGTPLSEARSSGELKGPAPHEVSSPGPWGRPGRSPACPCLHSPGTGTTRDRLPVSHSWLYLKTKKDEGWGRWRKGSKGTKPRKKDSKTKTVCGGASWLKLKKRMKDSKIGFFTPTPPRKVQRGERWMWWDRARAYCMPRAHPVRTSPAGRRHMAEK